MSILVTYASKYGATQGIAERIAERLVASGLDAQALPVNAVVDPARYDAFVIGSAAYVGSWRKEATAFVQRNSTLLAARPVWLFSSGPLGTATTDAQGRDVVLAAEPKGLAELKETIGSRGVRVFFGALDPGKLGHAERLFRRVPAGRALLPEGDFRDWNAIEAWANGIAQELGAPLSPAHRPE